MSGVELMDVTLAGSDDQTKKTVCPYFRVGYCKYRGHCKHFHPSEDCEELKCRAKNCMKRHRKPCRFGETCSMIDICEFLHREQRRKITDIDAMETNEANLMKLIQSKDDEIKDLTVKLEQLETTVNVVKEDIEKLKTLEEKVKQYEKKVLNVVKDIDRKVEVNFILNYQRYNIATTSDIKQVSIKLEPVLKELGFDKSCDGCWEVFKTDRQLRHHKKEKHVEEE